MRFQTLLKERSTKKLLKEWKKRKRKNRSIKIKTSSPSQFFSSLHNEKVPYVVLRWPEETLDPDAWAADPKFDIDILVAPGMEEKLASVAYCESGPITIEVYSVSGLMGMNYVGMPYYPPALAQDILNKRVMYPQNFYIPSPREYALALAYHIVYHKGLNAGISSGVETIKTQSVSKRDYDQALTRAIEDSGLSSPERITLLDIHQWLKSQNWSMPFDLMIRWPTTTDWIEYLSSQESGPLNYFAEQMPNLIVYILREDVEDAGLETYVIENLKERFRILESGKLQKNQKELALKQMRGGNWIESKGKELIGPFLYIVCKDENPIDFLPGDKDLKNRYPHIKNKNVLFKHTIRDNLQNQVNNVSKFYGIHGSDNAVESQYMLQVIFGKSYKDANNRFLKKY